MRWLLCALTVGLFASAPARADDDDWFKDYHKQLREQQRRQAKFYREQQKRYEERLREDRKRQERFLRDQRERQEDLFREHRRSPYGYDHPGPGGFYPPQTFGAPPFVPNGLHPGAYYPNPVFPGYGLPSYQSPFPGYFPPMSGRRWHGDDDDDDDDD